jgi:hypothetical protein
LAFVDQVRGELIITIETDREAGNDDLVDPDIEIMRPLRLDGAVLLNGGGGCRIVEKRDRGRMTSIVSRAITVVPASDGPGGAGAGLSAKAGNCQGESTDFSSRGRREHHDQLLVTEPDPFASRQLGYVII